MKRQERKENIVEEDFLDELNDDLVEATDNTGPSYITMAMFMMFLMGVLFLITSL